MKKFAVVLTLIFLTGCGREAPTVVTRDVYQVVTPPSALLNCPALKATDWPHPDTATNQQLADFLAKLYERHKVCRVNMEGIKRYIAAAKARIGQ